MFPLETAQEFCMPAEDPARTREMTRRRISPVFGSQRSARITRNSRFCLHHFRASILRLSFFLLNKSASNGFIQEKKVLTSILWNSCSRLRRSRRDSRCIRRISSPAGDRDRSRTCDLLLDTLGTNSPVRPNRHRSLETDRTGSALVCSTSC